MHSAAGRAIDGIRYLLFLIFALLSSFLSCFNDFSHVL